MNEIIAAAFRNMFRIGEVVEIDYKKVTAKVEFKDADGIVSGNLQVLQDFTVENESYKMPDLGEKVACLFLGNGSVSAAGFIIGKVYNNNDVPFETGADIAYTKFKDGTLFKYDRNTHTATADIKGDVDIIIDGNDGENDTEKADGNLSLTVKKNVVSKIEGIKTEEITEKQGLTVPEFKLTAKTSVTVETDKTAVNAETSVITKTSEFTVNAQKVNLGENASSGVVCQLSPCPLFGVFHTGSSITKTAYP